MQFLKQCQQIQAGAPPPPFSGNARTKPLFYRMHSLRTNIEIRQRIHDDIISHIQSPNQPSPFPLQPLKLDRLLVNDLLLHFNSWIKVDKLLKSNVSKLNLILNTNNFIKF